MSWTGPIDEEAIRSAARQMADFSAETQIALFRARHRVGDVLTPAQLAALTSLEMHDMMRGVGIGMSPTATGASPGKQPYFEFQVEKQVTSAPGMEVLKYPDALRVSKVEGEVLAQFIVDSTGRYEAGSLKVLKSSHELFTQALRDALPLMHFTAATVGGVKVRQLVQQPFIFTPSMK